MPDDESITIKQTDIQAAVAGRTDFRTHVQEISEAVMSALERRHLERLDLRQIPHSGDLQQPGPEDLRFLKLSQVGHGAHADRTLNVLNVQNYLGTYRNSGYSLVSALGSDGRNAHLYLGARTLDCESTTRDRESTTAFDFLKNLRRSVEGNMPGTRFQEFDPISGVVCPQEEINRDILQPLQSYSRLAAVTGIPSLRVDGDAQYAQSLDRLTQALQGQQYLMLIVAEPVVESDVNVFMQNCLRLGSDIHSLVSMNVNQARAIGDAEAKGTTKSTTTGGSEAKTDAKSETKTAGKQPGAITGGILGAAVGLALTPFIGAASIGIGGMASSMVTGIGGSSSQAESDSKSTSRSKSWGESFADSLTQTSSSTETSSLGVEYLNKTADFCEKALDSYVHRLQRSKSLGLWSVGVYFLADDPATFNQGCAQLRSLYSGSMSYLEPMRVVDLSLNRAARNSMGAVISTFRNPDLGLTDSQAHEEVHHPLGKLMQSLSTPMNTEELSLLLNPPRREVPGLKMQLVADFGVNPSPRRAETSILLGNVISGGSTLDLPVRLDMDDLARHAFITGLTGSGKTNTCFGLLKAASKRVPFLVIEPVKSEYRSLLQDSDIRDLRVYTLGDEMVSPFRINPFQFVPGVNLVTHIDYLKAIFNASFPMYAAMPYILEEAVVEVYQDRGWDLTTSANRSLDMGKVIDSWRQGKPDYSYTSYLPTLSSLYDKIDQVVGRKGYAQDVTQNYAAALKARIRSLIIGSKGRMMDTQCGVPFDELFGKHTVLEMKSMGDDDEKCFIMGLLLTLLYEYREQQYRLRPEAGIRHLTVLEESHRLLGRAGSTSGEVANPRGKAVETFANMLAEIREYGEGFMIIDQTPAKLIPDAIKNTSTKLIHRLAARDDREMVGESIGVTDEQQCVLPRLKVGEAVVHMQDQDKPILIRVAEHKRSGGTIADDVVRERMLTIRQQREAENCARILQRVSSLASCARSLTAKLRGGKATDSARAGHRDK